MDIEKIMRELTLEEKAALCSGADFSRTKAVERLGIPSVMLYDGPHGLRKQKDESKNLGLPENIEAVCFPTASALASSFDRGMLRRLGETLGEECLAENVAMLLGPSLNIKRSPLCGRNFEYFSEDPYLAGQMGVAYVTGLQSKGIAPCVKHYAANNQETRRMTSDSVVDERTLREIYLPAFEAVAKEGKARGIMCSYNRINGVFSSENQELLTAILRGQWGFDGLVVTDWGAVKDRVQGLRAGLDLEMPGPGRQDAKIVEAVKNGVLDEASLDKAVFNILKFISEYDKHRKPGGGINYAKDRALAGEFAKECAVLLKNENNLLPLAKTAGIAFIGEFAQTPRYQGSGSSFINTPCVVSALEAAAGLNVTYAQGYRAAGESSDKALLDEAVAAAKAAEIAVVFAGLPDSIESEGFDRDTMALPENQNRLIEAVAAVQPKTVVVLHTGSPVELPWADKVPAILTMYLGGEGVGSAAVSLLFGDANPCGKLAETWPLKLADNPSYLNFPGEKDITEYREGIYVGYRYYDKKEMVVRFPFGYGLSYTSFVYSDMVLEKTMLQDTETLAISCTLKNTGTVSGKEAVQVYVRDLQSTAGRPIRELKEFAKVELAPGEQKKLSFTLDKRAFAYYEPRLRDWHVESGVFTVEIGASSRDIRLCGEVEVRSTAEIPVQFTRDSAVGDLARTERGRAIMASFGTVQQQSQPDAAAHNLGAGGEKLVRRMRQEMPLSYMVNLGYMTDEQLESLLLSLKE